MLYTIVNFTTPCGENRHTDFAPLIHGKLFIELSMGNRIKSREVVAELHYERNHCNDVEKSKKNCKINKCPNIVISYMSIQAAETVFHTIILIFLTTVVSEDVRKF